MMRVTGRMLGLVLAMGLPAMSAQAEAPATLVSDTGAKTLTEESERAPEALAVALREEAEPTIARVEMSWNQAPGSLPNGAGDEQRVEAVPPAFLAMGLALLGLVVVARRGPAASKRLEGVLQAAGRA